MKRKNERNGRGKFASLGPILLKGTEPLVMRRFRGFQPLVRSHGIQKYVEALDAYDLHKDCWIGLKGYGIPAIAFKIAIFDVLAVIIQPKRDGRKLSSRELQAALFVDADDMADDKTPLVTITGEPAPAIYRNGVNDFRGYARWDQWSARLCVRWNDEILSAEDVHNAIEMAGFVIGVGQWRPDRGGLYGTWRVAPHA